MCVGNWQRERSHVRQGGQQSEGSQGQGSSQVLADAQDRPTSQFPMKFRFEGGGRLSSEGQGEGGRRGGGGFEGLFRGRRWGACSPVCDVLLGPYDARGGQEKKRGRRLRREEREGEKARGPWSGRTCKYVETSVEEKERGPGVFRSSLSSHHHPITP